MKTTVKKLQALCDAQQPLAILVALEVGIKALPLVADLNTEMTTFVCQCDHGGGDTGMLDDVKSNSRTN